VEQNIRLPLFPGEKNFVGRSEESSAHGWFGISSNLNLPSNVVDSPQGELNLFFPSTMAMGRGRENSPFAPHSGPILLKTLHQ
jgi:hypothetical protein